MKEGFLIGGAFIFAGLVLETSVGPVVWDAFRWPVNGIVLFAFLFVIVLFFLLPFSLLEPMGLRFLHWCMLLY